MPRAPIGLAEPAVEPSVGFSTEESSGFHPRSFLHRGATMVAPEAAAAAEPSAAAASTAAAAAAQQQQRGERRVQFLDGGASGGGSVRFAATPALTRDEEEEGSAAAAAAGQVLLDPRVVAGHEAERRASGLGQFQFCCDERCARRYLRAYGGDAGDAATALAATLQWRREVSPAEVGGTSPCAALAPSPPHPPRALHRSAPPKERRHDLSIYIGAARPL